MIVYDVQDMVKYFPGQTEPANKHISLSICQGEIFGILGDNGAGKSTLVRQMANLLRSDASRITLFGRDITEDSLHVARNVGYMPQDGRAAQQPDGWRQHQVIIQGCREAGTLIRPYLILRARIRSTD